MAKSKELLKSRPNVAQAHVWFVGLCVCSWQIRKQMGLRGKAWKWRWKCWKFTDITCRVCEAWCTDPAYLQLRYLDFGLARQVTVEMGQTARVVERRKGRWRCPSVNCFQVELKGVIIFFWGLRTFHQGEVGDWFKKKIKKINLERPKEKMVSRWKGIDRMVLLCCDSELRTPWSIPVGHCTPTPPGSTGRQPSLGDRGLPNCQAVKMFNKIFTYTFKNNDDSMTNSGETALGNMEAQPWDIFNENGDFLFNSRGLSLVPTIPTLTSQDTAHDWGGGSPDWPRVSPAGSCHMERLQPASLPTPSNCPPLATPEDHSFLIPAPTTPRRVLCCGHSINDIS